MTSTSGTLGFFSVSHLILRANWADSSGVKLVSDLMLLTKACTLEVLATLAIGAHKIGEPVIDTAGLQNRTVSWAWQAS